jgi:O-acetyl-ADP-ribose deacetylase (regulator of RNase III)
MATRTPESKTIAQGRVTLMIGDITDTDVEAFVFYARPDLALGTGFGTAISARGGASIQRELEGKGPLATGEAVVTAAGKLRAQKIVHAVGPRFQEEDMLGKLKTTVANSLKAAETAGVRRLALPAMGAGFYGVPLAGCARVMGETIRSYLEGGGKIEELIVCVLDSREYDVFKSELEKIA